MEMFIQALLFFSLLITAAFTVQASVLDFCVADASLPHGPAGYSCKDPKQVKASDFFFGLGQKGNTSNPFRASVIPGIAPTFGGVNGLGISISRVDIEVGGVVPFHAHPGASEITVVIQGNSLAGFVSTDYKVYTNTLNAGEAMAFPQGLLHFQINTGNTSVISLSSFGSDNPGLQLADLAFFGNDLPSDVVAKTTFLDPAQIQKLKKLFGGTN